VLYVARRLNFEEELPYSAVSKCDSVSEPGGKMGPWVGTRLKTAIKQSKTASHDQI